MRLVRLLLAVLALCSVTSAVLAADPAGYKLVWSDEFDGDAIDKTKWDFDLGNGFYNYSTFTWISGWGNEELQYYTREPENAWVSDGKLHIKAIKESYHGCGYTSAKLKTRKRDGSPLYNKTYGRVEFHAKLPTGQGVWPALWMLPQDDKYGTWASSGEIDVMEAKGQEPNQVHGTLHFGGRWPANAYHGNPFEFPAGQSIADFHTYAVEWEPGEIRWYVDEKCYAAQSHWWSTSKIDGGKGAMPAAEADLNPWPAPFDQPFYLIMNVAVGGRFLGRPNADTKFPAEMLVEYVRVYDKTAGYDAAKPRGSGKLPFEK